MRNNINEVRERLERDAEDFIERGLAVPTASDIRALLTDHARLQADAAKIGEDAPTLCDLCRTREEVRSDAEGIPFARNAGTAGRPRKPRRCSHDRAGKLLGGRSTRAIAVGGRPGYRVPRSNSCKKRARLWQERRRCLDRIPVFMANARQAKAVQS